MSENKDLGDLITNNKDNAEKLSAADKKSAFSKDEIEKKISKLILANRENAIDLSSAHKIISTQEKEIKKQAEALIRAVKEKEKRRADLLSARKELLLETAKAKHVVELTLINKELTIQINERKLAEKALFESEERFRLLFNQAPLAYQAIDFDGNFIEVNQTWLDTLGYTREEVIGKWFGDFLSPAFKDGFRKQYPIFKAEGKIHSEFEMVHKNGKKLFFAFEGKISYNNIGKFKQTHCILQDITESKLMEEALRDSEEKYRQLFEESPSGIALVDMKGILLEANPNLIELLDISREELLGKSFTDLVQKYGLNAEIQLADFGKRLSGRAAMKEISFCKSDGKQITIEVQSSIILQHGESTNVMFIVNDITERKLWLDALQKSDAKHNAMISNISDVIGIVGADGIVKYGSPNVEKLFGLQPQDFIGTNGFSNVHSDDMERVKNEFIALLEIENSTLTSEFKYKCNDGSYKQIEITAKNLTNDLLINGVLLNYHDISERKQAENALRESEERFKAIFNQSPIAIALIDKEGRTIISNLPLSDMVGYSNDELSKMKFTDFTYHEDADKDMKKFLELIGGRISSYSMEKRFVHKNGKLVWGNLYVTIIHDENSNSKEILGMVVDITERKQAESELIKAKDKAEESERLKTAFLCNMSHEIRTPMNGILGFSELLKNPELSGENQQKYISIIEKSGARMLNTINDIVDISKIDSGLVKVVNKQSNINDQTDFVYVFFKPQAEAKGIKLSYNNGLTDAEALINTDMEKVYSILTNLVKNAIKYTNEGSIEFGYFKKGDYFEFYVTDTGIGIPHDRQKAIFERFIQADIEDKNARQGAGLGLAISKSYVEMLGGTIWVESKEGIGSTFYFTLPHHTEPMKKSADQNAVVSVTSGNVVKSLKILIVDDDEISEFFIYLTVKTFGSEILKARTGVEAIEVCRNNPDIDLILMDIRMPVMNGYEATRQIRQFNNEVVIIAQTAFAQSGDKEKSILAGCNDYISKPINKDELVALIEKYFRK